MKKLLVITALLLGVFTFTACSRVFEEESTSLFASSEELLGFSVVSTVTALHGEGQESPTAQNGLTFLNANEDPFEILSEIEALEPYLKLVETFMGGTGYSVEVRESEMEDYEHTMVIAMKDITGETIHYTMHYNETIVDETTDEDQDYEEYESVLEGIMVIGETTYTLYGEREVDEGEEELQLTAKIDDENYATLEYEHEYDQGETETEFLYELYRNNVLVKSIEIDFEQDAEETEMSLKFLEGEKESEYDFEIEREDGKTKITIEYKIEYAGDTIEEGDIEVEITFDEESGNYHVTYTIEVESKGQEVIEREYDPFADDEDPEADDDDDDDDEDDEETAAV